MPQPCFHGAALIKPLNSKSTTALRQLLTCTSSSDFVASVNFDRRIFFDLLLSKFSLSVQSSHSGVLIAQGQKYMEDVRSLTEDNIGLGLLSLKCSGGQNQLCPIFRLVPSAVFVWLDYGLGVLHRTLRHKKVPEFRVKWPTTQEMDESAQLILENRPNRTLLPRVFAVVDVAGRYAQTM